MSTPLQQRNNLLVAVVIVMGTFFGAILLDWIGYGIYGPVDGQRVTLAMPGTSGLPAWLLLSFSAVVTAVGGLNLCRITTIPRWVLTGFLLVCGAYYTLPFFIQNATNPPRVYAGPFVALAATVAAVGLVWTRSPLSVPVVEPTVQSQTGPGLPDEITTASKGA